MMKMKAFVGCVLVCVVSFLLGFETSCRFLTKHDLTDINVNVLNNGSNMVETCMVNVAHQVYRHRNIYGPQITASVILLIDQGHQHAVNIMAIIGNLTSASICKTAKYVSSTLDTVYDYCHRHQESILEIGNAYRSAWDSLATVEQSAWSMEHTRALAIVSLPTIACSYLSWRFLGHIFA